MKTKPVAIAHLRTLGKAIKKMRMDEHKGGCNAQLLPKYPDACDCGYTELKKSAKLVGIKI